MFSVSMEMIIVYSPPQTFAVHLGTLLKEVGPPMDGIGSTPRPRIEIIYIISPHILVKGWCYPNKGIIYLEANKKFKINRILNYIKKKDGS